MLKSAMAIVGVGLVLIVSSAASAAPIVYAVGFPNGNPIFETVNLNSGAVSVIGTVQYGGTINDIASDPTTGKLYGLSGQTLFTINPTNGVTNVVGYTGVGDMETLAFNPGGNLYVGTQHSLYSVNKNSAGSSYLGEFGAAFQANGTIQNIRFNGSTLYATNTDPDAADTDLYAINTSNASATWIGEVQGHPGLALGNYGTQMYGSSLPAIHGGATLTRYIR